MAPNTREYNREYARKWRANNPERVRATDKKRNIKRGLKLLKKRVAGRKCCFCGRVLWSPRAGKRAKRYCAPCRKDPEVKRHMSALYQRRFREKKQGQKQESLNHAEDTI